MRKLQTRYTAEKCKEKQHGKIKKNTKTVIDQSTDQRHTNMQQSNV